MLINIMLAKPTSKTYCKPKLNNNFKLQTRNFTKVNSIESFQQINGNILTFYSKHVIHGTESINSLSHGTALYNTLHFDSFFLTNSSITIISAATLYCIIIDIKNRNKI